MRFSPITAAALSVEKKLTPSDVHIDRYLTNLSVGWMQGGQFVHDIVFPSRGVANRSDIFRVHDLASLNRGEFGKRAPGTETKGTGHYTGQDQYMCEVYGLHTDIDDQTRANADSVFRLNQEASMLLTENGRVFREAEWASKFFTTGVWSTDVTGVAAAPIADQFLQWNDPASTPIADVKALKTRQRLLTGLEPNVLVMGQEVWDALSENAEVLDRLKYGQTASSPVVITRAAVAAMMEIDRILVGSAVQNMAEEGLPAANQYILGKDAALYHLPGTPGWMRPTPGVTFAWTGYAGSNSYGSTIRRFRMDPIRADRIEMEMAFDMKMTAPDLGVFMASAVA